jgi:DnaJ-class molecular chaperone
MSLQTYCPKCKKKISPPTEACPDCGKTFFQALGEMKICPNCKGGGEIYNFQRDIDDPQMKLCTVCNGLGHVDK